MKQKISKKYISFAFDALFSEHSYFESQNISIPTLYNRKTAYLVISGKSQIT